MVFISAVITGRNDNYGGHLIERATYCINTMLETFDEVIYVDWNTESGKKTLTDEIKIKDSRKLKTITIHPELVKKILNGRKASKMCEVLARNIGIRQAKGDLIVSTNIDIIAPVRNYLDALVLDIKEKEMIVLTRTAVELDDLHKRFGTEPEWNRVNEILTYVHGAKPLQSQLMCPLVSVNRETLLQNKEYIFNLSSVIMSCGDFQIAHRDTWYNIKGFEESMLLRNYADTNVQYKVIMAGGNVRVSNFPVIYHVEHYRASNDEVDIMNKQQEMFTSKNSDSWGIYE